MRDEANPSLDRRSDCASPFVCTRPLFPMLSDVSAFACFRSGSSSSSSSSGSSGSSSSRSGERRRLRIDGLSVRARRRLFQIRPRAPFSPVTKRATSATEAASFFLPSPSSAAERDIRSDTSRKIRVRSAEGARRSRACRASILLTGRNRRVAALTTTRMFSYSER